MISRAGTKTPKRPLEHLAHLGDVSRETEEGWVKPLTASSTHIQNAGSNLGSVPATAVTLDLGVTGGALTGAAGLKDFLTGVADGDKDKAYSGFTDVTTSAAALQTLHILAAGPLLGPVSTVMLAGRALKRMDDPSRSRQLSGLADLVTATAVTCTFMPVAAALKYGLGVTATIVSVVRGLHELREGHDQGDVRQQTTGLGQLVAGAGLVLLTLGLTTSAIAIPGIGLVVGGSLLPLLAKIKPLHGPITAAVKAADKLLYPLGLKVDEGLDQVARHVGPLTAPVRRIVSRLAGPLERPVTRLEDAAFKVGAQVLNHVAHTHAAQSVDHAAGVVTAHLSPIIRATLD